MDGFGVNYVPMEVKKADLADREVGKKGVFFHQHKNLISGVIFTGTKKYFWSGDITDWNSCCSQGGFFEQLMARG